MEARRLWRAAAIGWTAFILIAVAVYQGFAPVNRALEFAGRYEAVHIVAHAILYGTLAGLIVSWLRSVPAAVLATVAAGAAQEGVQCLFARHWAGGPELFDVMVDAIAAGSAALVVSRTRAFTLLRSVRGARHRGDGSAGLV